MLECVWLLVNVVAVFVLGSLFCGVWLFFFFLGGEGGGEGLPLWNCVSKPD